MSFIDKELFEEAEDLAATLRRKRSWLNDDEKNYFDDYEDSKDYMNESGANNKYVEKKDKDWKDHKWDPKDKKNTEELDKKMSDHLHANSKYSSKDFMGKNNRNIDNKDRYRENKERFKKDFGGPEASEIHKKINTRAKAKTESMSMAQKYDYIIREYYDISDSETRKIVVSVSEADKNQVLSSLTNKLYNNIVEKVDDIDFGTIPNSKGDFTKVENYEKIMDCINILTSIMKEYHQDTKDNIDIIREAVDNLVMRREIFMKSFQLNLELPIILYNTIALSIISSVSFMISSCIEFIKSPTQDSFTAEIDKVALNKTKDNVLFSNLAKFNEACKRGQIDSTIDYIIKNKIKNFTGYEIGVVLGGIALIGLILNIIPIMRELIYFFYYSRVRVSDYFAIQADLLQMNAHNLESNTTMDKEQKKKIVKKQMKIVELFRKISNKVNIDNKSSEVKATKEITKAAKEEKYKYSDINDSLPDSVASSNSLF